MANLVTTPKSQVMDSSLSFFINQLTKLDPKLYTPLYGTTYLRDFKLRTDVSLGNESTSFILSTFAAGGTLDSGTSAGGGLPYVNSGTTALSGVSIDGQLITTPLRPLAMTLGYTEIELLKSQQVGNNIDAAKFNAINTKYQMSADQMAYIGDATVGATGLVNKATVTNVSSNASGKAFSASSPTEILNDFNEMLTSVHAASGFAFAPDTVLMPFAQFGYLSTTPVSTAGSISILEYIKQNCFATQVNGGEINIKPVKWAAGKGAGSTDRMVAYTNDYDRIRFPMVPIAGFTPSYRDLMYSRPYAWALGETEIVYPETIGYRDGI